MRGIHTAALLGLLTACAAPPQESEPVTRMVYLEHASAEEVAEALRPLLPPGVALDQLAIAGSLNGILLRGSPDDCDRIEAEIRRLDRSAGD